MVDINVSLKTVTCQCGTVYAVPHWINKYDCPLCSYRSKRELLNMVNERDDEIEHIKKVVSGLRGAIKRMKRNR